MPSSLHLLTISFNVYFRAVFNGECSFHFGWRFIWVVVFNNENTLLTSNLTHRGKSRFCKMFITMLKYKIFEASLMRNEAWEYILSCGLCFMFLYDEYLSSYKRLLSTVFCVTLYVHVIYFLLNEKSRLLMKWNKIHLIIIELVTLIPNFKFL